MVGVRRRGDGGKCCGIEGGISKIAENIHPSGTQRPVNYSLLRLKAALAWYVCVWRCV